MAKFEQTDGDTRFYMVAAGLLFLWLIAGGIGGMSLMSHVSAGDGFESQRQAIIASELAYRFGLLLELSATLASLLLGFALYVLLRRLDWKLAVLGLVLRGVEAAVGAVGMVLAYARLDLYLRPDVYGADPAQLIALTKSGGSAAASMAALLFGFGSLAFFMVLRRSSLLPTTLSIVGVIASIIVIAITTVGFLEPSLKPVLQYGWIPMAIAEVGSGLWLTAAALRTSFNISAE